MRVYHILGLSLAASAPLTLAAACGGSGDPPPFIPATGGTESASGGAPNPGGAPGSGGKDSGNSGGEGGLGLGGMGGVPVSIPDFVGPEPCDSDKDCTADGLLCDDERRVCTECIDDADCGDAGMCERGACVTLSSCENSLGCSSDEVCVKEGDAAQGVCQECGKDADCGDGGTCVAGSCRTTCDSDKDCTSDGLLCSDAAGLCTECIQNGDCSNGEVCAEGDCVATVCAPGSTQCLDNRVITCREDGQGYLEPKECGEQLLCSFSDGEAFCGTGTGGGSGDAILEDDFSDGSGRWGLSGGASNPEPNVVEGRLCVTDGTFTLGWPSDDGPGFDLPAGDYVLSFVTQASESVNNLNAKVALSVEPFSPVYVDEPVDVSEQGAHSVTFEVGESGAENVGIAFNVGGNQGTLCLDDIVLEKQ